MPNTLWVIGKNALWPGDALLTLLVVTMHRQSFFPFDEDGALIDVAKDNVLKKAIMTKPRDILNKPYKVSSNASIIYLDIALGGAPGRNRTCT